jgi:NAD(P)-dependent dehydrogenase (short-subunit alcohol dehydrogenase family)
MEAGQHGVKVFAIESGTVRTGMANYALESEEGQRWLPWLGETFKRGEDVPPNHAADLVVLLASGLADALSGRFFTINDDVVGLVERARGEGLGDVQTLRLIQP